MSPKKGITKRSREYVNDEDLKGVLTRSKRRKIDSKDAERNKPKSSPKSGISMKRSRECEYDDDFKGVITRSKRRKIDESRNQRNETTKKNDNSKFISITACVCSFDTANRRRLTKSRCLYAYVNSLHRKKEPRPKEKLGEKLNGKSDKQIGKETPTLALMMPEFEVNEIIWAKIKGHCHWPAKIERINITTKGLTTYEVIWYNDYRRSKIHKSQAFKFMKNFEEFAKKFDDVIGLKTAAFEAMYTYGKRSNVK